MSYGDPVRWHPISSRLYHEIFNELKPMLGVYSVAGAVGSQFMTTWALGDVPLLKYTAEQDERHELSREPKDHKHFIALARYLEGE